MTKLICSVVTPSLNQGAFIVRTVESVLSQNIAALEYWIMDGGSTDATLSVLAAYRDRIHVISEPDHGQANAINKGFQRIQGNIVGWLNSDDIYYPNTLSTVLDFFEKNPDINLVYGRGLHIDEADQAINEYPTKPFDRTLLTQSCFLCQPAVFFRRSLFEKYGFLEEKLQFCMDYEFWLRLALAGEKFHYLENVTLAGSRLHHNCKTIKNQLSAFVETMNMLKEKLGKVPENWLLSYGRLKAEQRFGRSAFASRILGFFMAYYALWKWNRTLFSAPFWKALFHSRPFRIR